VARKRKAPAKHPEKHPDKRVENLQPHPPFSANNQPAPERRSGGPNPITRAFKKLLETEGHEVFAGKVLALAKRGNKSALDHVLDRVDGVRTQHHVVAAVDLSGASDEQLARLESILAGIGPGQLPDA